MIANPHFAATFAFNVQGQSTVVEQDSEGDLVARAKNVLVCPKGFREDLPEFGVSELLFRAVPLDLAATQAEVARWANLQLTMTEHAQGLETATRIVTAEVTGG